MRRARDSAKAALRGLKDGMKKGKLKMLGAAAQGRAKAVRQAFKKGASSALARAEKGIVPALAIGGVTGTIGAALARKGMLSYKTAGGKRIPLALPFAIAALYGAWRMRKRPAGKILLSTGISIGAAQGLDWFLNGFSDKGNS